MGLWFLPRRKDKKSNKKLAVALGSGGALGMAHLGVLKAFEESNIKFDIVTGTSIGSIVGAMLSSGYTSTDMVNLLKSVNFSEMRRLIMIRMNMDSAQNIIDDLLGQLTFEELALPFAAVAVDLETGDEVVLNSGNIARAVSASSAIAPFFKPVEIGGRQLVDGAYANAVPADVAKQMGADYVIGVDLSSYKLEEPQKKSIIDNLFLSSKVRVQNPRTKGYENADIMLKPDLQAYRATDLSGGYEMFEAGYEEAMANMDKIKSDLAERGFPVIDKAVNSGGKKKRRR